MKKKYGAARRKERNMRSLGEEEADPISLMMSAALVQTQTMLQNQSG